MSFLTGVLCMCSGGLPGAEPLVFISAFASGEKAGIHSFRFDSATGTLQPLHRTADIQNPFFLAVSPDQRFLYAINAESFGGADDEFVAAYALDGRDGRLKRLNQHSARGTASCYLDVDATGKTVAVANYASGSVASLPVKEDGSLGEAVSFVQHSGSGADPVRQKGPNAHCIVISPDNRFALAADLGIDKILIYQLDAAAARLTPNDAQPFVKMRPASGPRHITFHPNGRHVYVINELANTVTCFDYAADSGMLTERQTLSTLPAGFTGKSHTADLKITPDGKFLYGTNRGHDSIASYRIAENGMLTLLSIDPSLGKGPQNLLITPDGRWLLCANMPGNSVVVFRIDAANGNLAATGAPVAMPMPSCIRWAK
ncbi:lactonase family protein [Prosthecobacter fluviatilis]|uniref:Lactonase family protein n=1 Tax=Prosthecobacter fluviatilis TaxID=445931 RepID=A0ABW0KYT2_9BACT